MFKKRADVATSKRITRELPRWRDDKKDFLPGEYNKQRTCFRRRWSASTLLVFALLMVGTGYAWRNHRGRLVQLKQRVSQKWSETDSLLVDSELRGEDERTFQVLGKDGKMRTITIGDHDDAWTRSQDSLDVQEPSEQTKESMKEQPTKEQPTKEQPTKEQPTKEQPTKKVQDEELDLASLKKESSDDKQETPSQKPIFHKKKPSADSKDKTDKFVTSKRKVRIAQKLTTEPVKHGDVGCKNNCDPQGLTYARQVRVPHSTTARLTSGRC